jgi:hypothetical protein
MSATGMISAWGRKTNADCFRLLAPFALVVLVAACDQSSRDASMRTREWDLQSVPVVENTDGPRYVGEILRLEKDLVIGGDEAGPDWQLFGGLWAMLVGPDGNIYLADAKRRLILIIDSEGRLIRQLGGEGSGPGEFQVLSGLHWASFGKEFWAEDGRLLRMTRFNADGELIDTFNFSEASTSWDYVLALDGYRFLGVKAASPFAPIETTDFVLLDETLKVVSRITTIPSDRYLISESGQSIRKPFTYPPTVCPIVDGRFLLADPSTATLIICDVNGAPVLRIKKDWDFPRVTHEEILSWREIAAERYPVREVDQVPIPSEKSPFLNYRSDARGNLWVEKTRSGEDVDVAGVEGIPIDIFSKEGIWLGTQSVEFFPTLISRDYAYYIPFTDAVGPRVERYRLTYLFH